MANDSPFGSDPFVDLAAFFDALPGAPPVRPTDDARPAPRATDGGTSVPAADGRSLSDILASLEAGDAGGAASRHRREGRRSAGGDRFVAFAAGGTTYGVRVPEIVEIARIPAITPVPQLPPWVRGVTNLRGDVISVIDLAALCGMDAMSLDTGRMLVARQETDDLTVGVLVDRVHEIAAIPADQIRQPTAPLEGALAPFVRGVCQRDTQTLVILDMAALLRSPDVRQFDDQLETSSV